MTTRPTIPKSKSLNLKDLNLTVRSDRLTIIRANSIKQASLQKQVNYFSNIIASRISCFEKRSTIDFLKSFSIGKYTAYYFIIVLALYKVKHGQKAFDDMLQASINQLNLQKSKEEIINTKSTFNESGETTSIGSITESDKQSSALDETLPASITDSIGQLHVDLHKSNEQIIRATSTSNESGKTTGTGSITGSEKQVQKKKICVQDLLKLSLLNSSTTSTLYSSLLDDTMDVYLNKSESYTRINESDDNLDLSFSFDSANQNNSNNNNNNNNARVFNSTINNNLNKTNDNSNTTMNMNESFSDKQLLYIIQGQKDEIDYKDVQIQNLQDSIGKLSVALSHNQDLLERTLNGELFEA